MTKRGKKAWAKWRRVISEQARSGQTVTAFCRERAVCRPYFFAWKKRLQKSATAKFLEVQVQEPAPSAPSELAMILDGIDVSKLKRVPRYNRAVQSNE